MSWNLVLESLSQPVINRYVIVFFTLVPLVGSESCARGFAVRFPLLGTEHVHLVIPDLQYQGASACPGPVWLQIIEPVMLIMLFGLLS